MTANRNRIMGSRQRASLVTDCALAQRLQVSARMVRLWVDTGAWPLPRCARRASFLFEILGGGAVGQDGGLAGRRPVSLTPQREEGRRSAARMMLSSNLF